MLDVPCQPADCAFGALRIWLAGDSDGGASGASSGGDNRLRRVDFVLFSDNVRQCFEQRAIAELGAPDCVELQAAESSSVQVWTRTPTADARDEAEREARAEAEQAIFGGRYVPGFGDFAVLDD